MAQAYMAQTLFAFTATYEGATMSTEAEREAHHRSGAWNSFGGGGSANATMIGIRTSF